MAPRVWSYITLTSDEGIKWVPLFLKNPNSSISMGTPSVPYFFVFSEASESGLAVYSKPDPMAPTFAVALPGSLV